MNALRFIAVSLLSIVVGGVLAAVTVLLVWSIAFLAWGM